MPSWTAAATASAAGGGEAGGDAAPGDGIGGDVTLLSCPDESAAASGQLGRHAAGSQASGSGSGCGGCRGWGTIAVANTAAAS